MIENDPNGKGAHELGAKMDAGKSPVVQGAIQYFPRAMMAVSDLSAKGAEKYAWAGWEQVPDGVNRYNNALGRHCCYESIEGPIDSDTGELHATCIAWNALARLELMLRQEDEKALLANGVQPSSVAAPRLQRGKAA